MAGVRVRQRVLVAVDQAVEERDEPSLGDVAAEDAIDLLRDLGGLRRSGRERLDGGLEVRHQQRRGDALADDVRDREAHSRRAERDGVVAVAADARGRLPRRADLEAFDLRHRRRQQLSLYPPRLVQLALLVRDTLPP